MDNRPKMPQTQVSGSAFVLTASIDTRTKWMCVARIEPFDNKARLSAR
jgi:hypothetical protein